MKKLLLKFVALLGLFLFLGSGNAWAVKRVYYSNAGGWSKINAYVYSNSDNNGWPGVPIEDNFIITSNGGGGYYYFDVDDKYNMIVFNNGSSGEGNQTANLSVSNNTVYGFYTGTTSLGSIQLSGDNYIYTAIGTYPSQMYIIGQVGSIAWNPTEGIQMTTKGNGIYTIDDIQISETFAFASQLGSNDNDWTTLNNNRYGPDSGNVSTNIGFNGAYGRGDGKSWKISSSGKYNVILNLANKTLTLTPVDLFIAGNNINGEADWTTGSKMTYENGLFTWSGTSLGSEFKIFDGNWDSDVDYGTEKDSGSTLTLGTPYTVVKADGCDNIVFGDNLTWIQNPTVTLDPANLIITVDGYRPMYLRGQMTVPTAWGANPSYLCSPATNQDGQTVYTLTVASFPGNSEFKFGSGEEENWIVNYGSNNNTDMEANNQESYNLTQGGPNMAMADSWLNVTLTLTIDKDDASKAYLMITGTKDDASNWTLTFGNDKTMQSGEVISGIYTLTIVSTSNAGLIYVYPPTADDIKEVYYMVTPNAAAETSSYAVGSFSKVNKITNGEYAGAYAISLPLGEGTLSLYYTDSNGTQKATANYNYKVEIGIPTAVDSIEASEEGEAIYYNLQGVRVENPEHGIFVKVVNGKATKVVR